MPAYNTRCIVEMKQILDDHMKQKKKKKNSWKNGDFIHRALTLIIQKAILHEWFNEALLERKSKLIFSHLHYPLGKINNEIKLNIISMRQSYVCLGYKKKYFKCLY